MYESPINIVEKIYRISNNFGEELDEYVMEIVGSYGVNVDKEELVKALKHDREQYDKGFRDGYEKGLEEAKIKAWCKEHCHPGTLCPDGYCTEAREGAKNDSD